MSELNFVNMTASEIDRVKCEKEKELKIAQENLYKVELAELELSKNIVNLQAQRKDLQISISKAKQIVRTLNLDIRIIISEFWRAKDNR